MEIIKQLNRSITKPFIWLIWLYQGTISPDHGFFRHLHPYGFCKYYPSCSMYAKESLQKQGVLAIPKIIKRLLSCNPKSLGGIDLP
jgi:uncharacterized protein